MSDYYFKSDEEILNELSNRIKRIRIEKNYSQEDVSKKTGISIHTISNIENGKSFTVNNLISLLRFYGTLDKLDELIPQVLDDPYRVLKDKKEKSRVSKKNNVDSNFNWGDEKQWKALESYCGEQK